MSSSNCYEAALMVASSKVDLATKLNGVIVDACRDAIQARGVFSIALSGGSIVDFLSTLPEVLSAQQVDPHFDAWHIILADERLVPIDHDDSNMGALQRKLLNALPIPSSQIYGIHLPADKNNKRDESSSSSETVAADYQVMVRSVIEKAGGKLDVAVLGFGPDGHTCSLFPNHRLLQEESLWVASLDDSPKPPPSRITLTFPVLNKMTRHVVFCGAGISKSFIWKDVFEGIKSSSPTRRDTHVAIMKKDPPSLLLFPCGAVRPEHDGDLTWIVDVDAMQGAIWL